LRLKLHVPFSFVFLATFQVLTLIILVLFVAEKDKVYKVVLVSIDVTFAISFIQIRKYFQKLFVETNIRTDTRT
jgi:hypothetical protein